MVYGCHRMIGHFGSQKSYQNKKIVKPKKPYNCAQKCTKKPIWRYELICLIGHTKTSQYSKFWKGFSNASFENCNLRKYHHCSGINFNLALHFRLYCNSDRGFYEFFMHFLRLLFNYFNFQTWHVSFVLILKDAYNCI